MKPARTQQQRQKKATNWWRELHGLSKDTAAGAAAPAEDGYQLVERTAWIEQGHSSRGGGGGRRWLPTGGELHGLSKDTAAGAAAAEEGYQMVERTA
jgi:hypothetical protein